MGLFAGLFVHVYLHVGSKIYGGRNSVLFTTIYPVPDM